MLITCVLACLLYWKKICCSPSVSQSVSQLKPTICLCVFLQTFFFPLNTETAKIIWSQAWKERIGINYPSLHIFEEHSSKFKATRFKFCLPPSAKFEPPEILRWAVTFTSVGGLWKYSTAFLNQMDFFSPTIWSSELETLLLVVSCIQQTQSTRNCPFLWSCRVYTTRPHFPLRQKRAEMSY